MVDCTLTNILSDALGIASLIPDAGPIFGVLDSAVGIVAQVEGC
jgi:hypothetical protein